MSTLPKKAGISLKPQHYLEILEHQPDVAWFEVHPENYMCEGGPQHAYLDAIRQHYPLSMHGVGASLGSIDAVEPSHLEQWQKLIYRYQPEQISEHLAWCRYQQKFSNDLLPIPYSQEALQAFSANVQRMQDALGRKILIENPSVYISFGEQDFSEGEFIREVISITGCGLLLDLNNIVVTSNNLELSPEILLKAYPLEHVEEIHLAGHRVSDLNDDKTLLIDNHGAEVCNAVWQLYRSTLNKINKPIPTLIEWDTDIPELDILLSEANKANTIIDQCFADATPSAEKSL